MKDFRKHILWDICHVLLERPLHQDEIGSVIPLIAAHHFVHHQLHKSGFLGMSTGVCEIGQHDGYTKLRLGQNTMRGW